MLFVYGLDALELLLFSGGVLRAHLLLFQKFLLSYLLCTFFHFLQHFLLFLLSLRLFLAARLFCLLHLELAQLVLLGYALMELLFVRGHGLFLHLASVLVFLSRSLLTLDKSLVCPLFYLLKFLVVLKFLESELFCLFLLFCLLPRVDEF